MPASSSGKKSTSRKRRATAAETTGFCNSEKIEDGLHDLAHEAGRQVRAIMNSADKEMSAATDTVKTHIHEKPVQSSAIALGIGFLLGLLFRRSSKDSGHVDN